MTLIDGGAALGGRIAETTPVESRRRRVRPGVLLSLLFIVLLVVAVAVPGALTHQQPLAVSPSQTLLHPSFAHLFGTDQNGRDVYARVVYGSRASLSIGVAATALALAIAVVLGVAAGLGGRVADVIVSRALDILFAFPALLLALLFVTVLGASTTALIIAVGLGSAPGYARMIRGQVVAVRAAPYVEAARVLGHRPLRIIARTILPNATRPLIVLATLGIGQSIVWASSLSFLGLGTAPPAAEWGAMLAAGRDFISSAWWLDVFPGLVIVCITLATTTLGRYLQARIEGRNT